jgi:hypothetical protein
MRHCGKIRSKQRCVCCLPLQGGCPEDTLDAATLANGYKWVPDALRITEANEPLLSLTCHNAAYWEKHNVDALRQVQLAALGGVEGQGGGVFVAGHDSVRASLVLVVQLWKHLRG